MDLTEEKREEITMAGKINPENKTRDDSTETEKKENTRTFSHCA